MVSMPVTKKSLFSFFACQFHHETTLSYLVVFKPAPFGRVSICTFHWRLVNAGLELNRQGSPQEGGSEEYDESFWDELDKVVEAVSVHQPHQQHNVLQQQDLQQQQQPQQYVSPADARSPEQFGAPLPTDYAASAPATTHAAALQPDHSGHASGHEAGTIAGEQRPLVLFGQTDSLVGAAARCTTRSFAQVSACDKTVC